MKIKAVVLYFLLVSVNCFSSLSTFFNLETNIPSACEGSNAIRFCTTRSLDDGSLKSSLLELLKTTFEIDAFVETGTYFGNTTLKAAQIFSDVHTIELSEDLYFKASKRLHPWKNVSVYYGASEEVFKKLLPTVTGNRILFYLDGHYSGHITAQGSLPAPLLEELQGIATAKKANSIILIDDIRLFQDSLFPEKLRSLNIGLETYPDLKKVVGAILKINPNYQICFLGDALLAFPNDQKTCVSPLVRACALHRLESLIFDLSEEELKKADCIISNAEADEKEALTIYFQTDSTFELEYGYRSYASLWHALILRKNGDEMEALSLLTKVAQNSMPNWRVQEFIK